ncbi:MAG: bifunctional 3,4-dihydroxy-2-butanone-4-phosphate synthase/GTP cyclohydrolase II [Gammaproteobacteria bacterium]|nr:bifunctional 3,4-dihydroxy-2-butanone-4-phosphate synthase/GTP cyclohydrolase II [Gammaproteobacteria bacterium]
MELNTTEEILDDLKNGRMVIIMDDEDRENEGDFVMAASLARPDDINFMATHGRGLICLTLTEERCRQLQLPLMVTDTDSQTSTNFTVSIEAAKGVTTGISAADRAETIRAAVAPYAKPEDIIQPGHIFPLKAQAGGVLTRAGHTEAGCDLMHMAGLEPAAVIVEILNEDGSMARRPDLEKVAAKHNIKIGTIADLIHYRLTNEKTITHAAECDLPTEYGTFRLHAFQDDIEHGVHLALVHGDITDRDSTAVRVHVRDNLCDLLGADWEHCGWPLQSAMRRIAREEHGVLVILCEKVDPRDMVRRIQGHAKEDKPAHVVEDAQATQELRTYGIGAQILTHLGVTKMKVLSSPKVFHGLSGFGLEVVEYLSPE